MNKYKTFEELKEELGDKFEDYMYKANIELLNKLDKIREEIKKYKYTDSWGDTVVLAKYIEDILEEIE